MVFVLNYLPYLLMLVAVVYIYRANSKKTLTLKKGMSAIAIAFVLAMLVTRLAPAYFPKGEVPKLKNPTFENPTGQIEDRTLKPTLTPEQRQERFDEKFDAVKQATEK